MGSTPAAVLFEKRHLSTVTGLRLADGRQVVVKERPSEPRLLGCAAVQRLMHERGFPCPRLLAGPERVGDVAVTAEELVGGGSQPARAALPELSARAFASLAAVAPPPTDVPPLDPPPPWVWWSHPSDDPWPAPDEGPDLNALPRWWVDDAADAVRARLAGVGLAPVVGHADWWVANVLWQGEVLHVVHDWDSVAAQPEAALAGEAAAIFSAPPERGHEPDVEESTRFLETYQEARDRTFSDEEREVAWAAGLWLRLFDVKKESVTESGGPRAARLQPQLSARLRAAGL